MFIVQATGSSTGSIIFCLGNTDKNDLFIRVLEQFLPWQSFYFLSKIHQMSETLLTLVTLGNPAWFYLFQIAHGSLGKQSHTKQ